MKTKALCVTVEMVLEYIENRSGGDKQPIRPEAWRPRKGAPVGNGPKIIYSP